MDWKQRHTEAMRAPRGRELAIVRMLQAWELYREQHRQAYESGIGDDGVLGPEWAAIGFAIRGLLNGDCGRLDCGTIDGGICDALTAEGFDPYIEGERLPR